MIDLSAWIDMIPVFGVIGAIATIGLKIGRMLQKLDNVIEDVKEIKKELKEHGERITALETKVTTIEKRLASAQA